MTLKLLSVIILCFCSLTAQTTFISSLKDLTAQCDYLVITPQYLSAEAQLLVKHRNSYSHDSVNYAKYALLEDIVSEFNDTTNRTKALWKGINWAITHWKNPLLKYIVLIGDDSVSFNINDSILVSSGRMPSWIRSSSFYDENGKYTIESELQSDHNYLRDPFDTLSSNLIPNVSIGRIPCETKEQLTTYISKVINFDTASIIDHWRSRVLLLADDKMQQKEVDQIISPFQVSSDESAGDLRGYQIKKLYLSGFKPDDTYIHADARRALVKELNRNYFLTIFNGHGAPHKLTDESVLTTEYCDSINNTRPGIFLSFCCEGAVFNQPVENSIVKKMLFKQGGFVCIVGSSSLAFASQGNILSKSLISTLINNTNVTIGKCMFSGKRSDDNYTLLGDPAILLKGDSINSNMSINNHQLKITSVSTNPVHYYYSISKPEHVTAFPNGSDFDYDSIVFSDSGTFSSEINCTYPALPDTGYCMTLYLWDDFGKEGYYLFKPENLNSAVSTPVKSMTLNNLISFDKKNIIIKSTVKGNSSFIFTLHDIQGRTILSRSGTISNISTIIPFDMKYFGNKYYIWKLKADNKCYTGRLVLKN